MPVPKQSESNYRIGNNLAKVRKCLEENYNLKISIQLLVRKILSLSLLQIEMLDAIEEVHNRGFIHRDVKAVSGSSYFNRVLIVELRTLSG